MPDMLQLPEPDCLAGSDRRRQRGFSRLLTSSSEVGRPPASRAGITSPGW